MAGVLLSGCGSPVLDVASDDVAPADQGSCRELIKALPDRVADQPRREVSGSNYSAAWGEEAIVLRCGVEMPSEFEATSECHQAAGIGWFIPPGTDADQSLDVEMVTVHRSPAVEVVVPASLRPPVTAMVDLAEAITQHTKSTGDCR